MLKLADLRNKVSREHSGERGKERIKCLGKRVEGGGGTRWREFQESGFIYDCFHSVNILEHFEWDNILNFKTPTASLFLWVYFRVKVQHLIPLGKLFLWNICPHPLRGTKDKMCTEMCVIVSFGVPCTLKHWGPSWINWTLRKDWSTELCALLNVIEMKIKQPPFESFGLCKGFPSQHRCAVSFPVSNLAGIVLPWCGDIVMWSESEMVMNERLKLKLNLTGRGF